MLRTHCASHVVVCLKENQRRGITPSSSSFSCRYKTNQYFGEGSTWSPSLLLSCNNPYNVPPLYFNLQQWYKGLTSPLVFFSSCSNKCRGGQHASQVFFLSIRTLELMNWFWWFDLNVAEWMGLFKLSKREEVGYFYGNK